MNFRYFTTLFALLVTNIPPSRTIELTRAQIAWHLPLPGAQWVLSVLTTGPSQTALWFLADSALLRVPAGLYLNYLNSDGQPRRKALVAHLLLDVCVAKFRLPTGSDWPTDLVLPNEVWLSLIPHANTLPIFESAAVHIVE